MFKPKTNVQQVEDDVEEYEDNEIEQEVVMPQKKPMGRPPLNKPIPTNPQPSTREIKQAVEEEEEEEAIEQNPQKIELTRQELVGAIKEHLQRMAALIEYLE